jgi:hypothetical protein
MLYEHKVELVNIHISKIMRVIKSKRFKYLEFLDGIFLYIIEKLCNVTKLTQAHGVISNYQRYLVVYYIYLLTY